MSVGARSLVALVLLASPGCGEATVAEFHVVSGRDDPLADATELVLALEQGETTLVEERFGPTFAALRLGGLPFGEGFRLRLDVLAGSFLVARGHSLVFDVDASGPSRHPDLWVAPVGRFESVTSPPDGPPTALAATEEGALLITEGGTLYRYVHHRTQDGRPELLRVATLPELAGAGFAVHGERLLAVGGDAPVARWVTADGTLGPAMPLSGQRFGATVVSLGDRLVILGGSDLAFGAAGSIARVARVLPDERLAIQREDELPCSLRDVPAVALHLSSPAGAARVVTFCQGSAVATELLSYDPDTGATARLTLPGDRSRAALASVGNGLALVAGGRDEEGRVSDETFVVGVGRARLERLSPGPGRLFRPREGAAALPLRPGLVLVVGGTDARGAVGESELVSFPGDVVLTGSMEPPAARPLATRLEDGAVAVVGAGGVQLWIVPR